MADRRGRLGGKVFESGSTERHGTPRGRLYLMWLDRFRRQRHGSWCPRLAPGRRVYAIGDVHGRTDLLDAMFEALAADNKVRGAARTDVVLLGDLIDRGPDSRGALARARTPLEWAELHCLLGNHEAIALEILGGNCSLLPSWLRVGGDATLASWGLEHEIKSATPEEICTQLRAAMTAAEHQFISGLATFLTIDDYLFVHAGIKPGVPLDMQGADDLLWIREPFLSSRKRHCHFVVHGHTVTQEAEMRPNRAGLDVGACRTGRLAAIGIEGDDRWIIEVDENRPRNDHSM